MSNDPVRILFVDDDELVLRSLQRSLRGEPHEAHFTSDPTDTLRIIRDQQIDIVVTDYAMPEMSGVEVLGLVRRLHGGVMRIMLTGTTERHIAVNAVNEGHVHRFLEKPWQSVRLRKVMLEIVEDLRIHRRRARLATRLPPSRDDGIARDERGAVVLTPVHRRSKCLASRQAFE